MSLIKRCILVEGPQGECLKKEYWEHESLPGRYGDRQNNREQVRNRKVRALMARKVSMDPGKYTWNMGYNHLAGGFSTRERYCPWSGSSLNRNKNLRKEYDPTKTIIQGEPGSAIALARASSKRYYLRGEPLPAAIRDYLSVQSQETERGFRLWFSQQVGGQENGIYLPIFMLSTRSRGKIKDKATAFFRSCSGDRIFCTLTFVAPVDDRTGVVILNKFLTQLRKEFSKLQYLWVAERQDNGNIHFHIIMNKRLPLRRYNALWVLQQYKSGLVGKNKYGEVISREEVECRYKERSIERVFNPVDVKRVRSISGLSSYLTKYITKQKKNNFFACLPWHCSRGVSKLFTRAIVSPSAFRYMMSLANCKLDKTTGEVFMPQVCHPKKFPIVSIVYVNKKDAPLRYLRELEQVNKWLIKGLEVDSGFLDTLTDEKYKIIYCKN